MRRFSSRSVIGILTAFVVLTAAGILVGTAGADPGQDRISGGFKDHFGENVGLQANSGPSGEDPSGHESATTPNDQQFRLRVICLAVEGNRAAYGTVIVKTTSPDYQEGDHFVEFARDGGEPNGGGDGWDLVDVPPGDPNNCAEFLDEAATAPPIEGGNITIQDAQP